MSSAFVSTCVFFIFGSWLAAPLHTKELKGLCWVSLRSVATLVQVFESVLLCVLPPKIKHIPVTVGREVPVFCPLVVGNVTVHYCPYSSYFQYIILGVAADCSSHWACKYLYFLVQSWAKSQRESPVTSTIKGWSQCFFAWHLGHAL